MGEYLEGMSARLRTAGFAGAMMVVTSQGGVMEAGDIARAPIHAVKSGPAMAPVAGRAYAMAEGGADTAIVADAGGTSYDVSLVRRMRIPWTREAWIGPPYRGHMTGFPSVDVRIVGAGGGSIAAVDEAGLLRVGPSSAGAVPGPACYGQGGGHPTVTDAALVLGYLDPDFFLGGRLRLHTAAAADVLRSRVAAPLGLGLDQAAAAVMNVVTDLGDRGAVARLARRRAGRSRPADRRRPRHPPGDLRHRRPRIRDRVRDVAGARAMHAARCGGRAPGRIRAGGGRRLPTRALRATRPRARRRGLPRRDGARRAPCGAAARRVARHHRRGRSGSGGPAHSPGKPGDHAMSAVGGRREPGRVDGVRLA